MSTLCSWEDVLGFKETYLVILKPNLSSNTVRDLNKRMSLKKEIRVPFRAPLFLGKWYGVATYFYLYQKRKRKKILITKYTTE